MPASPGQLSESARKARRSLVRLSRLSREKMFCNPGVALDKAADAKDVGDGVTVGGALAMATASNVASSTVAAS